MQVRLATGVDAEAIERIRVRSWQVAYRHVFPRAALDGMAIEWSRWVARLDRPPRGWATFVAVIDGAVGGFASVGPSRDEEGIGELYAIYVDPARWSAGIGGALISAAEERHVDDYAEATLWVLEQNDRARRFYERAGWDPDGSRKLDRHLGISVAELRYRKRLSSSRSRS